MRVRRLGGIGAAALVLLAACSSGVHPRHGLTGPTSPRPGTQQVVALGHGARLFSWTTAGRADAPWLLYVHGGSWLRGRANSPTARWLAAHELPRGYQVFSVDYRLSTVAPWPAQRDDVATAVDRIRTRRVSFGIAADRGVIVGESAGGQLAAVEATSGRFAGAVDLAGVVDPPAALHAPFRALGKAARQLVGCTPADCPVPWRDTRAATHLGARTPPFLVEHSAGDPIVPVVQSRTFAALLRATHHPVTLRIVPGHAHGLLLRPGVLHDVERFADRVTATG